jgi:hypothetical protein
VVGVPAVLPHAIVAPDAWKWIDLGSSSLPVDRAALP